MHYNNGIEKLKRLAILLTTASILLASCGSTPKLPDPTIAPYPKAPAELMVPAVRPKPIVGTN